VLWTVKLVCNMGVRGTGRSAAHVLHVLVTCRLSQEVKDSWHVRFLVLLLAWPRKEGDLSFNIATNTSDMGRQCVVILISSVCILK